MKPPPRSRDERPKKTKRISLERVVVTSFLVDISDVVVNALVAFFSGSVTMLAQALEGGADLLSSGLILIGMKSSKRPADKLHPYGYGRELYFWTFLSGLATFGVTAVLSFYWGLRRFLNPEPIDHLAYTYVALLFAMATNGYAVSLSYRRLLKKKKPARLWQAFKRSAMIETKTTFILDLMGTTASILGLLALGIYGLSGDMRFDGLGAMATGLILGFFALFILKDAKALLVGQAASSEIENMIKDVTLSFPQVLDVLDLRTLLIGPEQLIVHMEIHLKDGLTTDEIEFLIDKIELEIDRKVPSAKHIQIELETPDVSRSRFPR